MTEPASDELIAELKAGLTGVTPGPWTADNKIISDGDIGSDWAVFEALEDDPPLARLECGNAEINARHIARCSPDNIAALLARIRQQDETIKRMDEALKPFSEEADRLERLLSLGQNVDHWKFDGTSQMTLGDFRAARAARKEPT